MVISDWLTKLGQVSGFTVNFYWQKSFFSMMIFFIYDKYIIWDHWQCSHWQNTTTITTRDEVWQRSDRITRPRCLKDNSRLEAVSSVVSARRRQHWLNYSQQTQWSHTTPTWLHSLHCRPFYQSNISDPPQSPPLQLNIRQSAFLQSFNSKLFLKENSNVRVTTHHLFRSSGRSRC